MKIPWLNHKKPDHSLATVLMASSVSSNQLSNYGPAVQALETYLRAELAIEDDRAVIASVNGTAAIHAIIIAFHIHHRISSAGTPAFTFPSNIEGPLKGATITDVDDDLNFKELPDSEVLIVTNLFGMLQRSPVEYEKLAGQGKQLLVFDNAATPFSFFNGKNSLNYGDASIVSLHHTKQIGFAEGGVAIVKKAYEKTVRSILNFGISISHQDLGFNGKMNCITAAYIHAHLIRNLEGIKGHLQALNVQYRAVFDGFEVLPDVGENSVPFCFPIFLDNAEEVIQKLKNEGVDARQYYRPVLDMPNATRMFKRIICLPCNPDVKVTDIEKIRQIIQDLLRQLSIQG